MIEIYFKKFVYRNSTGKSQEEGKIEWQEEKHHPLLP